MYYLIKTEKGTFASKELVKFVRRIGDAGIVRQISKGELESENILSVPVYKLTNAEIKQLKEGSLDIMVQDLPSVLRNFHPTAVGDEELCSVTDTPVYEMGSFKFVAYRDLGYARKYAVQGSLPIIEVAGFKFVALNVTSTDNKYYISYNN